MDQKLYVKKCDFYHFGAIFSPKALRGREPDFYRGQHYLIIKSSNKFQVITKFQKNLMDGSKVICQKVWFWFFFILLY
jgi:hypothetical protein